MAKLKDDIFETWRRATSYASEIEAEISKRLSEVLEIIFRAHGWDGYGRYSWWYEGAEAGELGRPKSTGDRLYIEIDGGSAKIPSSVWQLTLENGLHKSMLLMDDSEIKQFVQQELDEHAAKKKRVAELNKAKEKRHQELIEQAMEKLTEEERVALGL